MGAKIDKSIVKKNKVGGGGGFPGSLTVRTWSFAAGA